MSDPSMDTSFKTSVAPWLSVRDGAEAVSFYKAAFGATESYRLDGPDGSLVVRLSVDGSEFWISGDSSGETNRSPEPVGGSRLRSGAGPTSDAVFAQALKAGASEVFPVGEDYGWRLGRVVDPFGLHWEIGRPLKTGAG